MKMEMEDITVCGVDPKDYPKFCDAFFDFAVWKITGTELTPDELDQMAEDYPELLGEMAFESML